MKLSTLLSRRSRATCAALPGLLALAACSSPSSSSTAQTPPRRMEPYQTETFYLSAAPASADGYPTRIIQGRFTRSDGKFFRVPAGYYIEGSWGASGTFELSGEQHNPAPDSLLVQWFAYAEDKFYEGRWALPQQRIYELLKTGFYNTRERQQQTYNTLIVCLVPGGACVVWLAADGATKTLVGRFQAAEIPYDWRRYSIREETRAQIVAARRAEMSPEVQAEIKAGTVSSQKWDTYLKTYPWKVEVVEQVGTQMRPRTEPLKLYGHWIEYLSAEATSYPAANTPEAQAAYLNIVLQPTPKAVPSSFSLLVKNAYGERHDIRVNALDEQETLAAFQRLDRHRQKEPLTLRVEVNRAYSAALTLTDGYESISLTKATVKIFRED